MSAEEVFVVSCQVSEVVLALLGVLLNFYILVLVRFSRLSIYNCLLACLALSHCLFGLFVLTFDLSTVMIWLHLLALPPTVHSLQWLSAFYHLQVAIMAVCNLWIICALVIDRYLIIVTPFRYASRVSKSKLIALFSFLALLLLMLSLPFWAALLARWPVPSQLFEMPPSSAAFTAALLVAFLLPSCVMIFCNVHLLAIIADHRNRIMSTIYVVQLNSSGPYRPDYGRNRQRESLLTTLNLFCTLFLVLPYFASVALQMAFNWENRHFSAVALLVLTLTPLVNGYIYGLRSQPIKKAFQRALQRYLYIIQMSNEIDQREVGRANSNNSKAQSLSSILQLSGTS